MDDKPPYEHEHRREPRVAFSWRATVRTVGIEATCTLTTVNVSEGGVCARGALTATACSGGHERYLLDLSLPDGQRLEGIEVAPVWVKEQGEESLSGWRFRRVKKTVRRFLQGELGREPGGSDQWNDEEIELWDYVKVLIKRRWLISGCTLLATLYACFHVAMQPPLYAAEARVFSVGEFDYLNLQERLTTGKTAPFLAVLNSLPLNRRMILKPYTIRMDDRSLVTHSLVEWLVVRGKSWNDEDAAEMLAEPQSPAEYRRREVGAMGWLSSMSEFEHEKEGVLRISVEAEFPTLAAEIANGYVDELGQYQLETSTANTKRNLTMARARMDTLQRELSAVQHALEEFKVANQNLLKDMQDVNLLMPEVGTKLEELQRELDLKTQLYTTVAEQYELLRLQREREATGLEVISQAEAPLNPRSTGTSRVALGAVLGFFAGMIAAFAAEFLAAKKESGGLSALSDAWREDVDRAKRLVRMQ